MRLYAKSAALAGCLLIMLWSAVAMADPSALIMPRSTIYIYQERDIFGDILDRTRGTQELSLAGWGTEGPLEYRVFVFTRLYGEFGRDDTETQLMSEQGRVFADLMIAQVEFPRIFNAIDITIGRQMLLDEAGLALQDGLKLTMRRDWYWGASVFVGSPVRNIDNRSLRRLEPAAPNNNPFALEAPLPEDTLPWGVTLGASVFLDNFRYSYAKVSWRRTWSDGDIEEDRLAWGLRQDLFDRLLSIATDGEFNFYTMELQRFEGSLALRAWGMELGAAYGYLMPLFPAQSIFTIFPFNPHKYLQGHISSRIGRQWWLSADWTRRFYDEGSYFPVRFGEDGNFADEISARVRYMSAYLPLSVTLYGIGAYGYGGDYALGGVRASYTWLDGELRTTLGGVVQYYNEVTWYDELLPGGAGGVGGGGVADITWYIVPEVGLRAMAEYNGNPVMERDFRMLIQIDVEAAP